MGIGSSPVVEILWAVSFVAQVALCGILIAFRHFRRLPFFTAYVFLNLSQSLLVYPIYHHYGSQSDVAYFAGWCSEAITLFARLFATVEILHLVLISYRGIWGLAWRLLAGTSVMVLLCVGVASRGEPGLALMRADRGYHLIFAVALIACLALIRYYFIRVANAYKAVLIGFCFYSCVKILLNTVIYEFVNQYNWHYASTWDIVVVAAYLIVLLFWGAALMHPLPTIQAQQAVLPTSIYEINLQLQAINKQLMTFWKIQEPRQ